MKRIVLPYWLAVLVSCLIVISILFIFASLVMAADIPVEWKQSANADGYKIQTSEDLGATWTEIPDLTFTTFTLLNEATQEIRNMASATITVADNILVLARVAAYNSIGITWRLESGLFYNNAWKPLISPTGLGAN